MLLEKDLIFTEQNFNNRMEIFEFLNEKLIKLGYVKDSFLKGLVDREKNYPTGLKTSVCGIAIPHTDSIHIKEEKLSVLTLKNSVSFENMDGSEDVDVKIVIMMLIKGGNSQIEMLQKLFTLFTDSKKIEYLKNLVGKEEIIEFFNKEGIK